MGRKKKAKQNAAAGTAAPAAAQHSAPSTAVTTPASATAAASAASSASHPAAAAASPPARRVGEMGVAESDDEEADVDRMLDEHVAAAAAAAASSVDDLSEGEYEDEDEEDDEEDPRDSQLEDDDDEEDDDDDEHYLDDEIAAHAEDEASEGDGTKQGFVNALIRLLEDSAHSHAQQQQQGEAATEHKDGETDDAAASSGDPTSPAPSPSAPFFSQSSLDAAFLLSCEGGHIRILHLLLPRISSLAISNDRGEQGLHLAARNGHVDIVELLVAQGADREARTVEGATPLFVSILAHQLHVAAFLLESISPPAQVNVSEYEEGESVLHVACRSGYAQLVLLTLRAGADASACNARGETSIDVAKNAEIARVLLEFHQQRRAHAYEQQHATAVATATASAASRTPRRAPRLSGRTQSRPVTLQQDGLVDDATRAAEEEAEALALEREESEEEAQSSRREQQLDAASPLPATAVAATSPGDEDDDEEEDDEEDFTIPPDEPLTPTPPPPSASAAASSSDAAAAAASAASADSPPPPPIDDSQLSPASAAAVPASSEFSDDPLLDPLPPYLSPEPLVPCSPFRHLPPGPASALFWTAIGVGADSLMFQPLGVYPFDRLVDTERILMLAQVAESMTGMAQAAGVGGSTAAAASVPEIKPNVLNESALYAVFALMKVRIQREMQPEPTAAAATEASATVSTDDPAAASTDLVPAGSTPPPPAAAPLSTIWRQRVLEAYEQVYSLSAAASGLRVTCTRLSVWSAVIALLARSLFGSSFREKKKIFTNPNGWERKLRQIQQQREEDEAARGVPPSSLVPSLSPTLRVPADYYNVSLPSTHSGEIQLTFKRLILMSKTFLADPAATAGGSNAAGGGKASNGCFCRECISELEVPPAFKQQFLEDAAAEKRAAAAAALAASALHASGSSSGGGDSPNKKKGHAHHGHGPAGKKSALASAKAKLAALRESEKAHFQPLQQRIEAGGALKAHAQQHAHNSKSMTDASLAASAAASASSMMLPASATSAASPASPPPYTLDSLILTSGPELHHYWRSLSMEEKWALTELPLTHLHALISAHPNWELLRGALESYTEYAWEQDLLELHEQQTITIADEMLEVSDADGGGMDELLAAMHHAIQMRHMEETGEMDKQFELTILNTNKQSAGHSHVHAHQQHSAAPPPLTLNLTASTQSSRQMLENLVLSEFARKIASAFLLRAKESRAAQVALELEMELLEEEREAALAGAGSALTKAKRKKLKKKTKEMMKRLMGGNNTAEQQEEEDPEAEAEAAAARAQAEAEKAAAAEAARVAAEAEAARLAAEAAAAAAALEAERERKRAEAKEAKLKLKRERKLARKALEAEQQQQASENHTENTSPNLEAQAAPTDVETAPSLSLGASAAAVAVPPALAGLPESISASLAAALAAPGLNNKARRALIRAARDEAAAAARQAEQERRALAGLPPLEEEEEQQRAAEEAAAAAAEAEANAAAEEEEAATQQRLAAADSVESSKQEESKEDSSLSFPAHHRRLASSPPHSFDDFTGGVMLICSREQIAATVPVATTGRHATASNAATTTALKILGLPRKHAAILPQLQAHSTALFLFNVTDRLLHGVYYLADSSAQHSGNNKAGRNGRITTASATVPASHVSVGGGFLVAASASPAPGTLAFPSHLEVVQFKAAAPTAANGNASSTASAAASSDSLLDPIPEAAFRHLFADGNRIRLLELRQVKELMAIFRARARHHHSAAGAAVNGATNEVAAASRGQVEEDGASSAQHSTLRTITGITPVALVTEVPLKQSREEKRAAGRDRSNANAVTAAGTPAGVSKRQSHATPGSNPRGGGRNAGGFKTGINVLTPIAPSAPSAASIAAAAAVEHIPIGPFPANPVAAVIHPSSSALAWHHAQHAAAVTEDDDRDQSPSDDNALPPVPLDLVIAATPHSHSVLAEFAPSSSAATNETAVSLMPRSHAASSPFGVRFDSLTSTRGSDYASVDSTLVPGGGSAIGGSSDLSFAELDSERMLQELEWNDPDDSPAPSRLSSLQQHGNQTQLPLQATPIKSNGVGSFLPLMTNASILNHNQNQQQQQQPDSSLFSFSSGVKQQLLLIDDEGDAPVTLSNGSTPPLALALGGSALSGVNGVGGGVHHLDRIFDSHPSSSSSHLHGLDHESLSNGPLSSATGGGLMLGGNGAGSSYGPGLDRGIRGLADFQQPQSLQQQQAGFAPGGYSQSQPPQQQQQHPQHQPLFLHAQQAQPQMSPPQQQQQQQRADPFPHHGLMHPHAHPHSHPLAGGPQHDFFAQQMQQQQQQQQPDSMQSLWGGPANNAYVQQQPPQRMQPQPSQQQQQPPFGPGVLHPSQLAPVHASPFHAGPALWQQQQPNGGGGNGGPNHLSYGGMQQMQHEAPMQSQMAWQQQQQQQQQQHAMAAAQQQQQQQQQLHGQYHPLSSPPHPAPPLHLVDQLGFGSQRW